MASSLAVAVVAILALVASAADVQGEPAFFGVACSLKVEVFDFKFEFAFGATLLRGCRLLI